MGLLPNILTLVRLVLIPVYLLVFYLENPSAHFIALILFILASFTDVLDGYLARKFDTVSKFGKLADPFADKLMQLSVLYTLVDAVYIAKWFFWIILTKETLQILLGLFMLRLKPPIIIAANKYGKATTVLIFLTIILAFFRVPGVYFLQMIVAILALITFFQYVIKFIATYRITT